MNKNLKELYVIIGIIILACIIVGLPILCGIAYGLGWAVEIKIVLSFIVIIEITSLVMLMYCGND